MERLVAAIVDEEKSRFPDPVTWVFGYGTTGFRDKGDKLDRVLFRMGILAALRSKCVGAAIGVVITASHNPVADNGVKIVDPRGEMLAMDWEKLAVLMANASTDELGVAIATIVESTGLSLSSTGQVICARDTRPSGDRLVGHLAKGVELAGANLQNCGLLTTPQLHYMVRSINSGVAPSEDSYYQKLTNAFKQLLPKTPPPTPFSIKLDGANGVGAEKVRRLERCVRECVGDLMAIEIFNDGTTGILNQNCGADYVKTQWQAPLGMIVKPGERCVTFDGDADRIVYFYQETDGKFHVLDGDRIATLVADFMSKQLYRLKTDLTIGVVQTAYANGSSTQYLTNTVKVPVACTLTGVKHLHHKAMEFDIGIYFEANGHGTVVYSKRALETLHKAGEDERLTAEGKEAGRMLLALSDLINQAVGDSMSDMLLVEVILLHKGWGCREWMNMYNELPSHLMKVTVKDRMVVKTTNFDRICTSPEGLQEEIDKLVSMTIKGRAFVRASGTEDVVRVYAEADTKAAADQLAVDVALQVYERAGGVGASPSL